MQNALPSTVRTPGIEAPPFCTYAVKHPVEVAEWRLSGGDAEHIWIAVSSSVPVLVALPTITSSDQAARRSTEPAQDARPALGPQDG
jgi:hypothetical protein